MNFDATFWVAVSFVIFIGVLFYFKVPQKIFSSLDESINKIKKDIEEAEKLKEEAKNILSEYEAKLDKSKVEIFMNKLKQNQEIDRWVSYVIKKIGLENANQGVDKIKNDSNRKE